VVLTLWTKIMARRCGSLPAGAIFLDSGQSLEEVFSATNHLRHSAVHRLPIAAAGIHDLVQSAQKLANTLGDFVRAAQLEQVRVKLEGRIKDMKLYSNFLEKRLDKQLEGVAKQRAKLDRKEREATSKMLEEDQENKTRTGLLLEATVRGIFGVVDKSSTQLALETNMAFDDNEEDEHKSRLKLADALNDRSKVTEPHTKSPCNTLLQPKRRRYVFVGNLQGVCRECFSLF